jgi:acetyl esterase/lipase
VDYSESAWLTALAELPADEEAVAGVRNGDLLALHSRPADPPGAVFRHGVSYRGSLQLHVYARADVTERAPAVVFIHGGGWAGGDPYMHIRHCHGLAQAGFVAATIAYRLADKAPWPASLEDARAAVQWVRDNAESLGADPGRIAVAGGSAGGQLAAMVALLDSHDVAAAVLWYPAVDPLDMSTTDPELRNILDTYFLDTSAIDPAPLRHVHPGAPPMLTITGADDELTTVVSIQQFHKALDAAGVANRLEIFEGRDHAFDLMPADWQASFDLLLAFLTGLEDMA